ncbi:MAG: hypothetical protein KAH13_02520 [Tenericutes bacterium]|nr:hypothetical protein [Mycoplasmatota bacterium]
MQSVISKVTQLDKDMRMKVKALEEEKYKLPVFLREQRKKISLEYEAEAKNRVKSRKQEIKSELNKTHTKAEKELKKSIDELIARYEIKKEDWIKEVYKQCIDSFQEE